MNVPSCTVRTRSTAGLKVTVSVSVDTRDALLIETGTVYGPPATRNSVPGGVTMICAGVAAAAAGAAVSAGPARSDRAAVSAGIGAAP